MFLQLFYLSGELKLEIELYLLSHFGFEPGNLFSDLFRFLMLFHCFAEIPTWLFCQFIASNLLDKVVVNAFQIKSGERQRDILFGLPVG